MGAGNCWLSMVVLASLLVVTGEELSGIDCYCDTVPRAFADVERIGSFTVFVGRSGHSFYARPAESFGNCCGR